jgi:hypothetical protein
MTANRRPQAVARTPLGPKAEADPSAWPVSIGTGLLILSFGVVWFVFLHGLTALGRMLMVWHFHI